MAPRQSAETTSHDIQGHGCIEDRVISTFNGEQIPENVEYKQVPGADAFFSSALDVIGEANEPESVTHSLIDTVADHIQANPDYIVHNDEEHGDKYDGCGFLGEQPSIYEYLADNIDAVIREDRVSTEDEPRARELAAAAGRLARREGYFVVTGGELVEKAVNAFGANLLSYAGAHAANQLEKSGDNNVTYDSRTANDDSNISERSFHLDADDDLKKAAEKYGVDSDDALLFAGIIAAATVRVLGVTGEIHLS